MKKNNPKNLDHLSQPSANTNLIVVGAILLVIGSLLLIGKILETEWLYWMTIPLVITSTITMTIIRRNKSWSISGSLVTACLSGYFYLYAPFLEFSNYQRMGLALFSIGMGWLLMIVLAAWLVKVRWGWPLLPAGVFIGTGLAFLSPLRMLDFVLFPSLGLGISLVVWGLMRRMIGLIIPGCLLITGGFGVFSAWANLDGSNALAQTGIMLVWFASGWAMISIFSKVVVAHFIWWPFIPGGILMMVGFGLFIAGKPNQALGFIGNTGALSLIFLGIYLLLLRRSIQK